MNLQDQYDQLWQEAAMQLGQSTYDIDPLLDSPTDARRGITLLARPPHSVLEAIEELLQPLRTLEPEQYYYPSSDVHVTVLSIISCYSGFTLGQISSAAYNDVVRAAVQNVPEFEVHFKGVTASTAGVLVQGFVNGQGLNSLRDHLRTAFQKSGLMHSIDSRYPIQTAHSTVVRYRKPLRQPQRFLEKLQEVRTKELGVWQVQKLELVFNDWYQRQANTQTLATFSLASS